MWEKYMLGEVVRKLNLLTAFSNFLAGPLDRPIENLYCCPVAVVLGMVFLVKGKDDV